MSDNECVKVIVRARPMNSREKEDNRKNILQINSKAGSVAIINPAEPDYEPKSFTFDAAYDDKSTQRQVYDEVAYPLVESVIKGFNGTIFAYGQTGCGKTHTMVGKSEPAELRGIIPNSFVHVFNTIKAASSNMKYLVQASFIEIYNEEVRDLLGSNTKAKLDLKEDPVKGVFVKDLSWKIVKNEEEIDHVMSIGNANRTVGSTLMNAESSRSHSIFTMVIECEEEEEINVDGNIDKRSHIHAGKLNLVDLAGSERASKTGAQGDRLKEGCKINLSLSALGNVISALVAGKGKHIPYRDSKLTRLLQDSLGGNTKTIMCAALGPADYNYEETLSTLRYANRAKNIKNKPTINEDPKDALLRQYKDEIERLTKLLESQNNGIPLNQLMNNSNSNNNNNNNEQLGQPQVIIKEVIKEVVKEVPVERIKEIIREVKVPIENNNNNNEMEIESSIEKCRRISKNICKGERSFSDSEDDFSFSSRKSNCNNNNIRNGNYNHCQHHHHHERRKSDLSISPIKGLMVNKLIEEEEEEREIEKNPKSARADLIPFNNSNNKLNDNNSNDDEIYDPFEDDKLINYNTPRRNMKLNNNNNNNNNNERVIEEEEAKIVNEINKVKEAVNKEEVIKMKEKENALKEYNNAIVKQRDKLCEELNKQKLDFENAAKAKNELEKELNKLKNQLKNNIIENENNESAEVKIAREEVNKRRKEQEKLLEEKSKEKAAILKENKEIENENENEEEEELKVENNEIKKRMKKLKDEMKKLKKELRYVNKDIEDREEEFENERQDLLDTIRELNRECILYNKIMLKFISVNELSNVLSQSKYDEENEDWIIPPIIPKSNWRNVVPLPDINVKMRVKEKKHHNNNNSNNNYSNNNNNNSKSYTPQLPHPPIYINKFEIYNSSVSRPLSRKLIDKSLNNNNNNNNNRPYSNENEKMKSVRYSPLDIESLNNNNNNVKSNLPLINRSSKMEMNNENGETNSNNNNNNNNENDEFTLPKFKKHKTKKNKNNSNSNSNSSSNNNNNKEMENENSFEDNFGLYDF